MASLLNISGGSLLGKGLPYDAEIEYLESTGTQYIAVGLLGKNNYDFDYKVAFTKLSTSNSTGIGGEYQTGKSCYLGMVRADKTFAYHYKDTSSPVVVASNIEEHTDYNVYAHLYSGEQYFIINGVKSAIGTIKGDFISNYYLRLFSVNSERPLYSHLKLYYCKIFNNGIIVRDYIPVRVGNVGYLYDKVSGQLFGNAGTGEFILGPDVIRNYDAEIEYLESDGQSYVITALHGTSDLEVQTKVSWNVVSGGQYFFGTQRDSYYGFRIGLESTFILPFYGNYTRTNHRVYDDTPVIIDFNYIVDEQRKIKIDEKVYTVNNGTVSTGLLSIFGYSVINSSGNISNVVQGFMGKIYYIRFLQNGIPVADFIPVRVGTTGYMYDKVSKKFFRNAGTGSFILGPDK